MKQTKKYANENYIGISLCVSICVIILSNDCCFITEHFIFLTHRYGIYIIEN